MEQCKEPGAARGKGTSAMTGEAQGTLMTFGDQAAAAPKAFSDVFNRKHLKKKIPTQFEFLALKGGKKNNNQKNLMETSRAGWMGPEQLVPD